MTLKEHEENFQRFREATMGLNDEDMRRFLEISQGCKIKEPQEGLSFTEGVAFFIFGFLCGLAAFAFFVI